MAFHRMRRRKHRPKGSFLIRRCRCKEVGQQFCLPCRGAQICQQAKPAEHLWSFKPTAFAKRTKAESFTLKAFRAGKATQMARDGNNLALILQAGEWKTSSFLRYLDGEKVDEERALWCTLEMNDREDENEELPTKEVQKVGDVGEFAALGYV